MIEDIEDEQTSALVSAINNPQIRQSSRQQNGIRMAKSPMVPVHVNGSFSLATIDEGCEINCLDQSFAIKNRIAFVPTTGQTQENVYVTIQGTREPVTWNLGNMAVVQNLGTNILIGEPGKIDNKIITISHSESIETISDLGNTIVLSYAPEAIPQIQGHKEPMKLCEDMVTREYKTNHVELCEDELTTTCTK